MFSSFLSFRSFLSCKSYKLYAQICHWFGINLKFKVMEGLKCNNHQLSWACSKFGWSKMTLNKQEQRMLLCICFFSLYLAKEVANKSYCWFIWSTTVSVICFCFVFLLPDLFHVDTGASFRKKPSHSLFQWDWLQNCCGCWCHKYFLISEPFVAEHRRTPAGEIYHKWVDLPGEINLILFINIQWPQCHNVEKSDVSLCYT